MLRNRGGKGSRRLELKGESGSFYRHAKRSPGIQRLLLLFAGRGGVLVRGDEAAPSLARLKYCFSSTPPRRRLPTPRLFSRSIFSNRIASLHSLRATRRKRIPAPEEKLDCAKKQTEREGKFGRTNNRQNSICQFSYGSKNGAIVGAIKEARARAAFSPFRWKQGEERGVTQLTFKISGRSPEKSIL